MTLRDHLEAIYDKHGELTPEIVVEEARPSDHPLHDHVFDVDVEEAAESWYRHRAHRLIQTVTVSYESDGEIRSVRKFHAVQVERATVYEPVEKIAATPFLRELTLRNMEREYRMLEEKYGRFKEFVALAEATVSKRRKKAA